MAKTVSPIDKLNSFIATKLNDNKTNFKIFKTFGSATEYISFGNYMLNAQLSGDLFLGLPNTRSLELAGPSGTGKTYLVMNMILDAQDKAFHTYYIDTEGAIDDEDLLKFGVRPESCTHIRTIKTYEKLIQFANTLISAVNSPDGKGLKIFFIVDSYGMLNTETAIENALKGKYAEDMGKRAKLGRELFRNITLDLSNAGIPMVFTNHTAKTLDLFAIDKDVTSGGEGPTYSASFITLLGKSNYMKETEDKTTTKTGVFLKARSQKNRKVVPMDVEIHLSWKQGMNKYVGLEKYLSWNTCGVEKGTIFTPEEFNTKYKKGIATNSKGDELRTERWKDSKGDWICVLNDNARTLAVKSSCQNVDPLLVFSDKVFTHETLVQINEKIIKPLFKYSDTDTTSEDLATIIHSATSEDIDDNFTFNIKEK